MRNAENREATVQRCFKVFGSIPHHSVRDGKEEIRGLQEHGVPFPHECRKNRLKLLEFLMRLSETAALQPLLGVRKQRLAVNTGDILQGVRV